MNGFMMIRTFVRMSLTAFLACMIVTTTMTTSAFTINSITSWSNTRHIIRGRSIYSNSYGYNRKYNQIYPKKGNGNGNGNGNSRNPVEGSSSSSTLLSTSTSSSLNGTPLNYQFDAWNWNTASVSLAGVDPDSAGKVNQDACFHFTLPATTTTTTPEGEKQQQRQRQPVRFVCCGVLDGHGKKGHELNSFLVSYLPTCLEEKLGMHMDMDIDRNVDMDMDIGQVLVESFEESHYAARMDTTVPAGRSGTTCVVTILDTETATIYTGNVGDSRAIVGMQKSYSGDVHVNVNGDNQWNVKALSLETTTAREEERQRIEQGQGRIDSGGNVWYGPVGIAMTRALGDSVMKNAGVIPTPEVTQLSLMEEIQSSSGLTIDTTNSDDVSYEYRCLILLASDGIFDVISNEDAIHFLDKSIMEGGNTTPSKSSSSPSSLSLLEDACAALVQEARDKWQAGLPLDVRIDDTTAVITSFHLKI